MSHYRRVVWTIACAVVISAGACGEGAEAASATPSVESEFPAGDPAVGTSSGEMRTIEANAARVAAGRELFQGSCVSCHGDEGEGRVGIGPALNSESFLAAASDGYLTRTIYLGRAGTTMPAWGAGFGRDGVENIVAYMRSWRDIEPVRLDDAPARGDAEAGAVVFREICAACHGNSGAGYQETANGTGIGRAAFLAETSNGYLRHIIANGKTNTPMKPFGRPAAIAVANLTNDEIENVITHLRASAW